MRLAGTLSLCFDGSPWLSLFSSSEHGGFLAVEICERKDSDGALGADVVIFVPPAQQERLTRAVAAFNLAMGAEGDP